MGAAGTGETRQLRWGIISTGFIADAFATGVENSRWGTLQAVASRSQEGAEAFREKHPGTVVAYPRYDELLADDDVDAVYVATPHPFHEEWATRAAEAGKAVLCEKPIGLSVAQTRRVVESARDNQVFLMEGYMYRCAPQTRRLIELLREGKIGQIRGIEASFSFRVPFDPKSRLFDPRLGGGGILDVGGYPVTLSRLVAGLAVGENFAEPEEFDAVGRVGDTGVDEYTTAVCRFGGGVVARLTCGVSVEEPWGVKIFGDEGWMVISDPWIPAKHGGATTIEVFAPGGSSRETVEIATDENLYGIEADVVATSAPALEAPWPALGWEESVATMQVMETWLTEVGVTYPTE